MHVAHSLRHSRDISLPVLSGRQAPIVRTTGILYLAGMARASEHFFM